MYNENINGKTRVCGIIGDPIEHTMSPVMQNAAFQAKSLNFVYVPFRVKRDELGKAIQGMRSLNIRGFNVTIPHKVSVIPFLDKTDSLAKKIGAVNTIVNNDGVLTGYNTDALGFLNVMLTERLNPADKKFAILGAGGAARSIAFSLAEKGATLSILNRHPDSANDLSSRIYASSGKSVEALELTEKNLKVTLEKVDILVNTTSLGMVPKVDDSPVPMSLIKPGLIVFDIIYNPLKTRLLKDAQKRGARVINGIEMLVWQGAAAFALWTGENASLEVMRLAALKGVERHED
jgi:shikimate dehydrogenase